MTALRFSANLTMLYTERPFLERFAAAAAANRSRNGRSV